MQPMAKRDQPSLFARTAVPAAAKAAAGRGVVVREVACKSLLNRGGIGDYSFNCYTGCGHACVYCYARFMQRFHPHGEPWGGFVDVKVNAPEVLTRQLRRLPPGSVFTCSACDGWQGVERHYRLTRRCCELLLEAGFHLSILTKSQLVLRDLDVFRDRDARVGVTITTPDEAQASLWEPHASSVAARVGVLKQAKAAGLATAVMFGPLLPGISDSQDALDELFALAAEVDVDHIWTDAMNPRPRVWPSVRGFLQRRRPDLLDLYRRVLFDRAFRARYQEELRGRIRRAAARAGRIDRLA
jgi:DNA repair photolyase